MKYVVIDWLRDGDMFTEKFNNKEDAIKALHKTYDQLTTHDRKLRSDLFVLESINPDEEAQDHLDGDCIERLI